jgi:uncharacterized protein (TIGR02246 family)
MDTHPIRHIIEECDRAISRKDYDRLMQHYAEDASLVVKPGMVVSGKENIRNAFIAISDYFKGQLVVEQGKMEVIEGAGDALVIMETLLHFPDGQGDVTSTTRRATYVFRKDSDDRWRCTIDNSYGAALLDEPDSQSD